MTSSLPDHVSVRLAQTPRCLSLALLAVLAAALPLSAQKTAIASYPLLTDLADATATYGPITLTGNPPPAAPANGVCVNGIYANNPGGQDVRTPVIPALNQNDFQIDVEFRIAALPTSAYSSILMGGNAYRWIGFYVQSSGIVGIKHNNANLAWSTKTLSIGNWYLGSIKYESGNVELHINGERVLAMQVGVLNTGNNLNFTTNDYSNARNHNGCIRNLVIWNDTTLGSAADSFSYGNGCGGILLSASGRPTIGNAGFGLKVSNVTAPTPLVHLVLGSAMVNPGIDLTPIGMATCFSFTSLDLGALGPFVATGGTATAPLPIPNLPNLTGAVLFTQGVSFSTATSLGLASSNATLLVLGN